MISCFNICSTIKCYNICEIVTDEAEHGAIKQINNRMFNISIWLSKVFLLGKMDSFASIYDLKDFYETFFEKDSIVYNKWNVTSFLLKKN